MENPAWTAHPAPSYEHVKARFPHSFTPHCFCSLLTLALSPCQEERQDWDVKEQLPLDGGLGL